MTLRFIYTTMVTFFSWRKINIKCGRSANRIVLAIRSLIQKELPRNRNDPIYHYYYSDFSGDSYLLNLRELLDNAFRYTNKEIAQYIAIASYRNYAIYELTGDASLDVLHSPVGHNTINKNRLLRIVGDKIFFKYEEDTNRRKELWP